MVATSRNIHFVVKMFTIRQILRFIGKACGYSTSGNNVSDRYRAFIIGILLAVGVGSSFIATTHKTNKGAEYFQNAYPSDVARGTAFSATLSAEAIAWLHDAYITNTGEAKSPFLAATAVIDNNRSLSFSQPTWRPCHKTYKHTQTIRLGMVSHPQ